MLKKLKILHLEDLHSDVLLIDQVLKKAKMVFDTLVVEAEQGFVQALKDFKPDVILADHTLPSFNSHTALLLLRETGLKIPFILVTGNTSEEFAVNVIQLGADDYILKDRLERLPAAIRNALEKFRLEKERRIFLDQLIKKEKRYRALVENADAAIVILSRDGKPRYVSPSIVHILGYSEREALQLDLFEIIHPDDRQRAADRLAVCLENPGIPVPGHTGKIKHKNGEWVWLEATLTNMLHDPSIKGIVDNFRDVTERKQAEEKVIYTNRLYQFISQINQVIVRAGDESRVFEEACRIAIEFGKFKAAWIGVIDTVNHTVDLVEECGLSDDQLPLFKNAEFADGPHDQVLRTGRSYVCNDIQGEFEQAPWKTFAVESGIKSCMVLPIRKDGKIFGIFNLYASEINFFNEKEIHLLTEVAGDISFALDIFEKDRQKLKADLRLKHSESRLNQAQAIAHLGSWELDLINDRAIWSAEHCKIYGMSECLTPSFEEWLAFIHPDDLEYVKKINKNGFITKKSYSFYHRIIRDDGTIRHLSCQNHFEFDKEGEAIIIYGVSHDVTESKLTEQALQNSEIFNKEVLASLSSHIAVIDAEGIIVAANKAWDEFALANGEISLNKTSKGSNYFDVCERAFARGDEIAGEALAGIRSVFNKKQQAFELEYPCHAPDELRWFCLHVMNFGSDGSKMVLSHQNITERKKAEEALQHSESNLQAIFENTNEGFILIDPAGNIKLYNQRAKETSRLNTGHEISIGASISDFVHEAGKENYQGALSKVLAGETLQYDCPYTRDNGEIQWFSYTINPVYTEQRIEGVCITSSDITERIQSRESLLRSESNLKAIIENTDAIIYSLDRDFRYIAFNQPLYNSLKQVYGLEIKAGDNVYKFLEKLDPADALSWQQVYSRALQGETVKFEKEFIINDHHSFVDFSLYPIWENEQVVGLSCFAIDITQQVRAKEELRKSEASYRLIVETANEGIWVLDEHNRTVFVNKKLCEIFGYSSSEMIGKESFYFMDEAARQPTLKLIERRKAGVVESYDRRYITKSGKQLWGNVSASPIFDDNGNYKGALAMVADITEKKALELERGRILSDMIQRNKELEQFSYIVSHNLRAPVANIIGLANGLNDHTQPAEIKELFLTGLTSNVKLLDQVIHDLNHILQVKREISEKKELVNFSQLVSNIQLSIQNLFQKEDVLIVTDFNAVNEFNTISSYMHSIFYNLILNSIKYRRADVPPLIEITSGKLDQTVTLTFKDNGSGIDLLKKGDQVFGLYKRFHHDIEGKGMGLFMVKTQVETLGGKISVQSEPGKGTEFKIEFEL